MNLNTSYLGLKLKNPLMPGASPLVDNMDHVRQLEDAGAAAIVMHSLFEEQIPDPLAGTNCRNDSKAMQGRMSDSYLPPTGGFALDPERYLAQLSKIKESVEIPVIGSLNGVTLGGWTRYAQQIQQAGADAIELNIYHIPSDPNENASTLESRTLYLLQAVLDAVSIPVAVKISPCFSALAALVKDINSLGAAGLVLFNRYYQPDIDIESMKVSYRLDLSSPSELRPRLRWTAVLRENYRGSIAVTGGVHSAEDVIKAILCGADAVQVVSSLLKHGPYHLQVMLSGIEAWLNQHGYQSIAQIRGCMSLQNCPDASAYERANYLRTLQMWKD
ncbi:MAG: dihydroorotate dehydrogenase-like protein [Luteolibacter sp.]